MLLLRQSAHCHYPQHLLIVTTAMAVVIGAGIAAITNGAARVVVRSGAASTDAFLDALSLFIEPVHLHYLWRPQLRDPADEMVLETALNGRADVLVTLNIADFIPASHFRLPVLTPGAFLRQLQEEKT